MMASTATALPVMVFIGNIYTRGKPGDYLGSYGEDFKPVTVPDQGAYRVLVRARHDKFRREALGSFSVLEGDDWNGNRLPDPFEKEYDVDKPTGTPISMS